MKLTKLLESEGPFYIYFDYTGAGRGPEVIAGPFATREEAQTELERDYDPDDSDYWVDPEYVDDDDECEWCGESPCMKLPYCEEGISDEERDRRIAAMKRK